MLQGPPYRLLSDERLARLAATGDDAAFGVLYERHEAALLGYCRSITRDSEDARDALQSAMAAAYGAVSVRVPRGHVRGWLFRIAHNEAINVLRRRRSDVPLVESDLTTSASAVELVARREAAHEALAEVAELPARQRGALVMRELHGLDYSEIAAALAVSEVNARQLVFAARSGVMESRAGRNLPCEVVRDAIEAGDRRAQRRRSLRAHLRSCDACRTYARGTRITGRRPILALPGGWLAGWASVIGQSASTGAAELMAPAKGVAVAAVAAAVVATAAGHDEQRVQTAAAHRKAVAAKRVHARAAAPAPKPAPAVVQPVVARRAVASPVSVQRRTAAVKITPAVQRPAVKKQPSRVRPVHHRQPDRRGDRERWHRDADQQQVAQTQERSWDDHSDSGFDSGARDRHHSLAARPDGSEGSVQVDSFDGGGEVGVSSP
jgi:RNA polymerase sigma factor (sigma-70 family)